MGRRRPATLALPHRPQPERIGGYLGRKRRAQAAFLGGLGTNSPAAHSAFSEAWWQFGANDGEPAHYLALAICPDGMRFKKSRVRSKRARMPAQQGCGTMHERFRRRLEALEELHKLRHGPVGIRHINFVRADGS